MNAARAPSTATPAPTMHAAVSPEPKASNATDCRAGWAAAGAWPTTARAAAIDWWAASRAAGGSG